MTRTLVGLALSMFFVLEANASPLQTTDPDGKPRILLFWSDYKLLSNKLPVGARKAIEKEARSIFAEAGIDLSFIVGSPEDHGKSDAHVIRIILMPRSAEGWTLPGEAMGAILERRARAGTVYIFVPVVERVIGHDINRERMLHDGRKAHALARALARVLAHETVHAIDPDIPHGPEGSVMSANLTTALLLGHRLSFHESTTKRFLDSLRGPF
jgi:hypothetical protein